MYYHEDHINYQGAYLYKADRAAKELGLGEFIAEYGAIAKTADNGGLYQAILDQMGEAAVVKMNNAYDRIGILLANQ